MCQDRGLENELIPKIASGFGGGIGNTGYVCGAVVGAVMAIGLIKDRGKSMEDWMKHAELIKEFRDRFEKKMGAIDCRDLTGADLTTKEGQEAAMNSDTLQNVCFPAVATAYDIVTEMLKE